MMTEPQTANTFGTAGQLKDAPICREARAQAFCEVLEEMDKYKYTDYTGYRPRVGYTISMNKFRTKLQEMIDNEGGRSDE